jgi:riboflavin kinase/FMN adenylyltransferase
MHICYDLRRIALSIIDRPVVTLGTFDGVHLGHQEILKRVTGQATKLGRKSVLLTYHPHPRRVLEPQRPFQLLTTLEEKIRLIESNGFDEMIVLTFDESLANTEARQFVDTILVGKLLPSYLVVGYDHGFGKDRKGGIELLRETGNLHKFPVEVVSPVEYQGANLSSTKIRREFAMGNFNQAVKMLGHSYPLQGLVQMGSGFGKRLGYPTCNLKLSEEKLLPPAGVYSCRAEFDSQVKNGMAYVGSKPSVRAGSEAGDAPLSVEVHIFDFESTLYDRQILLYLGEWIREDKRFDDLEDLREQIKQDEMNIREKQKLN